MSGSVMMGGSVMMIANAAALDTFLRALNESGYPPDLPFLDAHGNPSIAHGMAPSGDDWEIGYEAPRDPDTGVPHCCQCAEHTPAQCGAGAMWTPTFPIVAITARQPTAGVASVGFSDDLIRWAKLDPSLVEIELSPYLHLAASFSGDLLVSNELPARLRDVAAALMSVGPIGREAADKQAAALPVEDAHLLLAHLARRARDRIPDQRGAVSGICRLVRAHDALAPAAVDAFKRIPPKDLQVTTVILLRAQDFDGVPALIADLGPRTVGPVHDALTAPTPGRRN